VSVTQQVDNLQAEINKKRQEIRQDSYPMSIGEPIGLYDRKEIEIHPEFQSLFDGMNIKKTD
jgi:hypothetical protein